MATRLEARSPRPVHGPAWPVSYGLVTQAGRCVAGPDWVGFQRVAAGLINCWVGLVRTVLAVLHGLHKYVRRIVLLSRIYINKHKHGEESGITSFLEPHPIWTIINGYPSVLIVYMNRH